METFTLDPRCWRIGRAFGRNPLLRRTDRIEAAVVLVALVLSLLALPVAGVVGSVVYEARHSQYVQEASQRHAVVATVTATGVGGVDHSVVQANWPIIDGDRSGLIAATTDAKSGQQVRIWIDKSGNPVDPPTPGWRALTGALGTALTVAVATGVAAAALVTGIRARLDRARDAWWEQEIRYLQENGGRTNQR